MLELWLFTTDLDLSLEAEKAGVKAIIIDWEGNSKVERQVNTGFECNSDTLEDLERISANTRLKSVCRVNAISPFLKLEIDQAIAAGADIIFLPMAKDDSDVREFMGYVHERAQTGVLIETKEAVENAKNIAILEPDFIYVGLNDLSISRGYSNIFKAVSDGTVEKLRNIFNDQLFGFGGVTIVDGGYPVQASLLLKEMSRLECDYGFLRRSFKKDIVGKDMEHEIGEISQHYLKYKNRSTEKISLDHQLLIDAINNINSFALFHQTNSTNI